MTTPKPPVQAHLPFAQQHPLAPSPDLRALQEHGTVHRVGTLAGDEGWLVTGCAQLRSLYTGDLLSRAHPCPDQAARATNSALFGGRPQGNPEIEDAGRDWFRGVLLDIVGPASLRALRPWVEQTVTRLLDALAAAPRPADLVDLVSVPLPALVVCKLLGVPEEELPRARELSVAAASAYDEQRSATALAELNEQMSGLIADGRIAPDGLLRQMSEPPYNVPASTLGPVGSALMFSGTYTTSVSISFGLLLLLSHPEQFRALREDPAKLPGAIEECLRVGNAGVNSGGNGTATYARTDFDLGGARIEAGELVLLDTIGANLDARIWDDPYRFDITRTANHHVTFGYGKRYCPGAGLARLELQALFGQLVARFPDLRLAAPLEELRTLQDQIAGGLVSLPVAW